MEGADLLAVTAGGLLVVGVLFSALRTVVLPSGRMTDITRLMFAVADRIFTAPPGTRRPLPRRFSSLYAPVALVSLPFAWSMLVALGFALVFFGAGDGSFGDSWVVSGSSLFTLGFAKPTEDGLIWLTFVEATIGLGLVALLISYLPTLYAAYSVREEGVGLLEPVAGTPATGPGLLLRMHLAQSVAGSPLWAELSQWFVKLGQSHTSFPALCRFPPSRRAESWVVTAGASLDAVALLLAGRHPDGSLQDQRQRELAGAVLALAHGVPSIVRIAQAAELGLDDAPPMIELLTGAPDEVPQIAVRRGEFDEALTSLREAGVLGDVDAELAWRRFALIRSSYEPAVLGLAGLTLAAPAPWSSDRAPRVSRPRFFSRRPLELRPGPQPPSAAA